MDGTNALRCIGAGIALLAALAAGDAQGQEAAGTRSIASAQEFLRQVLPGNRYASTVMGEILARATREGLRGHFEPLPEIFDADPLEECRSYLLSDTGVTDFIVRDPASGDVLATPLAELMRDDIIGSPDGFHFGSIRALSHSGSRVAMRFAGEQEDAVLYLEGAEIAARVHDALDYLRRHCDTSAATGF